MSVAIFGWLSSRITSISFKNLRRAQSLAAVLATMTLMATGKSSSSSWLDRRNPWFRAPSTCSSLYPSISTGVSASCGPAAARRMSCRIPPRTAGRRLAAKHSRRLSPRCRSRPRRPPVVRGDPACRCRPGIVSRLPGLRRCGAKRHSERSEESGLGRRNVILSAAKNLAWVARDVILQRSEESGLGRHSTEILRCAQNDDLFGGQSPAVVASYPPQFDRHDSSRLRTRYRRRIRPPARPVSARRTALR